VGDLSGLSSFMNKASTIEPLRDFVPIANAFTGGLYLFVRAGLPARSLDELIAYSKANPGKLNFASSSTLCEIVFQALKAQRGLDAASIPYKGSAPTVQALLSGDGDFSFDSIPSYLSHVQAGKIRVILTTATTSPLSDVPTMTQLGIRNFDATFNVGVFAPAQTPPQLVAALNPPLREAVGEPAFAEQMRKFGGEASAPPAEEFRRMVEAELRFWKEAARIARYEPQ
jgi:tripartite-type tricarboxylate transporter receptor subunit TctC